MGRAVSHGTWAPPDRGAHRARRQEWAWSLAEELVGDAADLDGVLLGVERRRVRSDCVDVEVTQEFGLIVAHVLIWRRRAYG